MPKDIPVGNGNFLLNFDIDYQIRDIYFPQVGQENHSLGHAFRFGVWVDGRMSWIGPEWEKDLRYRNDTVLTNVHLRNSSLGIELRCTDGIDVSADVYIKKIEVYNLAEQTRNIRLFIHHDFHLYGNDIGETAYYDPRTRCLLHYKAQRYFLINYLYDGVWGVRHFACGDKVNPERLGTWKDAEDGVLSNHPVGWGATDSIVGLYLDVPPQGTSTCHYIMAAGKRYQEVVATNRLVMERHPDELMERTSAYWRAWVLNEPRDHADLPQEIADIFQRSLLILRTQIDNGGAIIAANDSDIVRFGRDTYSYMWGRDGAFVAAALARAGYSHVCRKFFEFVAGVLTEEGYLFQHYNPDGSLASNWHAWIVDGSEVLPIQEDSTALVLWALWIHFECSKDIEFVQLLYEGLILRSAEFLVRYRDPDTLLPLPSYDLWEERYSTHTYTCSAVIAGLDAAARFARLFHDAARADRYTAAAGHMRHALQKYLYDVNTGRYARSGDKRGDSYVLNQTIDISLLSLVTHARLPAKDGRIRATFDAVREALWVNSPIGGCARYVNDRYYRAADVPDDIPGNPWFIATLWLAEYYITVADTIDELHKAMPYIEWCGHNALPSGVLAEQVHPLTGEPLSVSPLTWSHSSLVWAVMEYIRKYRALADS